jgi:hypothetical protein
VISTPGLEARWRQYSTTSNAFSFSFGLDGHDFYVITFPSGNETFVYDFSTALWHERESYAAGAWIARDCAKFVEKYIVSDRRNGNLYTMSPGLTLENGQPVVGRRISPHYWNERKRVVCNAVEVEFETGPPDGPTVPALESKAQLRWSKDNGHTWSNWQQASLGQSGERAKRVIWRRIGLSRDLVFELQVANETVTRILGANAEFTLGES